MSNAKHRKPVDKRKVTMRRWRIAFITVIAIPLITGSVMIGMHGFAFFVFRSQGTGESGDSSLCENQGPGQPDGPGTPHYRPVPLAQC